MVRIKRESMLWYRELATRHYTESTNVEETTHTMRYRFVLVCSVISLCITTAPLLAQGDDQSPDAPAFVWTTNIDHVDSANNPLEIGPLIEAVIVSDDELLVSDERGMVEVDPETGEVLARLTNPEMTSTTALTLGPDGTIWAYNFSLGLVNFDDDFEIIMSTGPDLFGNRSITHIGVADDGMVFAFVPVFVDMRVQGTVYVLDGDGNLRDQFITNSPDSRGRVAFENNVFIFPQDDGNLLLFDENLNNKIVDRAGNVVAQGIVYDSNRFTSPDDSQLAIDMERDATGNLFITSFDGVQVFDAQGQLIDRAGMLSPDPFASGPFAVGELPDFGRLVVLDRDRIVVTGNRRDFSVVTLIDLSRRPPMPPPN